MGARGLRRVAYTSGKTYDSIVKGNSISEPGIPESFKVLIKEFQSLALDVKVLTEDKEEIGFRELTDDDYDTSHDREQDYKEVDVSLSMNDDDEDDDDFSLDLFGGDEEDGFDDVGLDDDESDSFSLFDDDDNE